MNTIEIEHKKMTDSYTDFVSQLFAKMKLFSQAAFMGSVSKKKALEARKLGISLGKDLRTFRSMSLQMDASITKNRLDLRKNKN